MIAFAESAEYSQKGMRPKEGVQFSIGRVLFAGAPMNHWIRRGIFLTCVLFLSNTAIVQPAYGGPVNGPVPVTQIVGFYAIEPPMGMQEHGFMLLKGLTNSSTPVVLAIQDLPVS